MYSDYHFYIDFNWEDCIDKSLDTYFGELHQLVELAYQHKAKVFYSEKYLKKFLSNITNLDENFSESIGNKIQVIIANAQSRKKDFYAFELCFAQENSSLSYADNVLSTVN